MIAVTMSLKSLFFDKPRIIRALSEAKQKAMSKAGAFIRRRARSSLKRRKASSAPGSPPSVHSGDAVATLKNIQFGYDQAADSVVIGPVRLNMTDRLGGQYSKGTAPQVHEFGGTRGVLEIQGRNGRWYRADQRSRRKIAGKVTRVRNANYPARPFMGPALEAEAAAGKIAACWLGVVKSS